MSSSVVTTPRDTRCSYAPFGSVLNLTNGLQQGGVFFVGPKVSSVSPSPVKSISEYIAKRTDSEGYFTMKILPLSPGGKTLEFTSSYGYNKNA